MFNDTMVLLAALFYVVVGVRLLLLGQRSGQLPERLLGTYFAATGLAYTGWQIPVIMKIANTGGPIDIAAWTLFAIGVVPFSMFVQRVFRPEEGWAKGLVVFASIALVVGMAASVVQGNAFYKYHNPMYWSLWIGYTTPCVWLCVEAFLSHASANRRYRVGLCDRLLANRYLLFGLFGLFQIGSCVLDLFFDVKSEALSAGTEWSLAVLEMTSVTVLFFAFFPPQFYERRFASPAPDTSEV